MIAIWCFLWESCLSIHDREVEVMIFERGRRIEVWCTREVPSGAWRPAEVITGNGHYYTVRFENGQVERVSRKVIRPSPPVHVTNDLELGDVIEFYDRFCWKTGKIVLTKGGDYFLVSLLGSSPEFTVKKANIRVRQSWQNDQWVVLGKEAESRVEAHHIEDRASMNKPEGRSQNQRKGLRITLNLRTGKIYLKENKNVQKSRESFTKSNKRPNCQVDDKYDGRARKSRAVECRAARTFEEAGAGDAESVGSCSVNRNHVRNVFQQRRPLGHNEVTDGYRSDAESSTEDSLKAELRRLELKAYRSILRALHAAGPLTWEREAMISDLRLYLNISNDEHLEELRRLVRVPLSDR